MSWNFGGVGDVIGPCPTPCRGALSRSISESFPFSPQEYARPQCSKLNVHNLLLFHGSADERLLGLPIRQGQLLHVDLPSDSWQLLNVSLHVNGLRASIVGADPGEWRSLAWSPFAMVMEGQEPLYVDGRCLVFRVSLTKTSFYIFATTGADAEVLREQWVADISRALRLLTKSVFPTFSINVEPLADVEITSTRLLAGYLIRSERDDIVSVLYCELHVQQGNTAIISMYENECCARRVGSVCMSKETSIIDRRGVDCSCFSVDRYSFAARSLQEKQMWLTALSNIKVKLMNCAPSPNEEELCGFREAVSECIANLARCEPRGPSEEVPFLRPCRGVSVPALAKAALKSANAGEQLQGGRQGAGPLFYPERGQPAVFPLTLATSWSLPRDLPPVMAEAAMQKLAQGVSVTVGNCPATPSLVEAGLSTPQQHAAGEMAPAQGEAAAFAIPTGGAEGGAVPGEQVVYRNAARSLLAGRPPQARSNFAMSLAATRPPRTRSALAEEAPEWSDSAAAVGRAEVARSETSSALGAVLEIDGDASTLGGGKGPELFWPMEAMEEHSI
mmetsp:Transcript_19869/g.46513  ORF Transcript_19869/g.46513 Transcript_19869/m.46513 type:complete len:561 (+) Transcript_19869:27-1709(+)